MLAAPRRGGPSRPRRSEAFLDTVNLGTLSGVSLGVNRPAKQGDIWPTLASDGSVPHWGTGFFSCHQVGAVTRIFFAAFSDPSITYIHHGYAEWDGTTLTFPTQNRVTFNGNTNNCLITPGGLTRNQYFTSWDEVGQQYVCMVIVAAGPPRQYAIYTSPSMPPTWTLRKSFSSSDFGKDVTDVGHMWRRTDGRAAVYYQDVSTDVAAYGNTRRHIGMLLGPSDGSLTGTWTDAGRVISAVGTNEQNYYASAWTDGDLVYVAPCIFDGDPAGPPPGHTISGTRNRIWKVKLYVGRADSGTSLTLVDADWLTSTGVAGEYDGGEIGVSQTIARAGDVWRLPFWGDADTHHQSPELMRHMGMAHLGYRRIGKVSGTGTVPLTRARGRRRGQLVVNTASGTVKASVRNPITGATFQGFASTDCDPITAGTFGQTVTWQGQSRMPRNGEVLLHLTAAEVNHAEIL